MGAGSSTEQRSPEQPEAGSATPAEPEPSGGSSAAEAAPGEPGDPTIAAADPATKLLQKNGQLSTVNGLAEQGELSLQEGALSEQEEEVTVADVGQRESEDVSERDSDKEMAANSAVVPDVKEGQEEMPGMMEQIPASESNLEELTQTAEPQANDVGFKKVFKFVGFKFTVKKDKTEKSDTVQLLTVKKDEAEGAGGSDGAGDHPEPSRETGEASTSKESELKQSTEKPEGTPGSEETHTEVSPQAESGPAAEEGKDEGEEKQEKEPVKSPDSPTSPVASETASPFKKFFTQGWAGWRKKTSFRKPREDELEASEKKKEQEPEKADAEEQEKTEEPSEKLEASEQPQPQEAPEPAQDARLSAEYEKVELPLEDQAHAPPEEKPAPLATEVFDEKVEIVAEVHVSTAEKETEEQQAQVEEAVESSPPETHAELPEAEPTEEPPKTEEDAGVLGGDLSQPAAPSEDGKAPSTPPEGTVSEVEMLSSQERIKVQGSPLKKLFTSSGLKKLSGKKHKGKRGGGDEESGEQHPSSADSPDSPEEPKGESSASSPEEPEEITCLEKGVADVPPDAEAEEGTTSDGEKKREGVTPWASFKKMVTPKKRVRRLSESDKEDEVDKVDKVKSATLSSTESAASETQEEVKGNGEEQKPEEPKRRVDTSVSWEALICVGSSKKRARKASSSDEEGGPKALGGDSQKPEEAGRDKEAGPDLSQVQDQGPGASSPEQAGSPSEGEGVSTWESFKRLVTSRKKSKSKLEEKSEDSVAGSGVEPPASDAEPGKEESWVSIRKFIPGRRKKRSDGKQEQAAAEDTGPTEGNEDDSDVPAVVPLSEYDAAEREKTEAQQAEKSEEQPEQRELDKSVVHPVTGAVVDGARAVSSIEERAPSWISASVTEPLEESEDEAKAPTEEVFEREVAEEEASPIVSKTLPGSQEAGDDTLVSEVELMSEAVMAAEATEEATEASGAEETADMVSAVSRLTESPDTTEEATPVQEVEVPDVEDQERRTQEVLQAVAEKVREESQLPDGRGPEDTIQTTHKIESKIPEEVGEAEEDTHRLNLEEEMEVVSKVHIQETDTEALTLGKGIGQATSESLGKVSPGTESAESSELTTTEMVVGVKSETVPEQAVAPDSAETLTESETNGGTPVAEFEAPNVMEQDKIMEIHEDQEVASGTQSQVTEDGAVPVLKQMPPAPSSFQSQEDKHSEVEEVLEHTDKEVSVETVHVLSKTEVIQEAGGCADEQGGDEPFVEGPAASADTEVTVGQKQVTEVALEDEVPKEAEFQKGDNIELQSHAKSLPTPVESEMVVHVGREKMEAKPTQVSEESLEQQPAVTVCEELSKQLVQEVTVTVIDGEKEVIRFEESSSLLVQEEVARVEIQVQSSEASLALTAAAVEKVLGEAIKVLETAETLESADAPSVPEETSSEKDDDLPAQLAEDVVPTRTESQAESTPVIVSVTPEEGIRADLQGDESTSQKRESDEGSEQVGCQEVRVSGTREEDLKAENEVLELETEGSKLVQNVIQAVVDQLGSTEETATDFQTQTPLTETHSQEAGQKIEKEESKLQASGVDEMQTIAAKEESALSTEDPTHPDVSKDVNEALEQMVAMKVESSRVNDQQLEEVTHPTEDEREAPGTASLPEDNGGAGVGERTEKSPLESQEDGEGGAVDDPGNQSSALEDAEATRGPTRESPDTNGPKLKEKGDGQEVELQEEKVQSKSEKEIKTQTQKETQNQEGEPGTPEPTES
ncbi:A-kinase anchor protein 12 isoform X1 [Vicugna pacos]|uniref:A-kinase anchor protein 12 isoform X1 n=2 Tax=Vicugna pacos TaxID=30538 RepID=A0A6J0AUH2_VICPA